MSDMAITLDPSLNTLETNLPTNEEPFPFKTPNAIPAPFKVFQKIIDKVRRLGKGIFSSTHMKKEIEK